LVQKGRELICTPNNSFLISKYQEFLKNGIYNLVLH